MALENIGAANRDDAFYRYKMPKMITKIEGRGNGIKTNIVNMVDIAKALARPPSYTTKYFGCELGAQSKFDEKTGTSLVNGSHDSAKLAGLLENFIKKYVQCYGCGNPETEIIITKTEMLNLKCAACGFLSDVDMRDKLTTFILKNPPEQKKSSKDKKAMRRAEKERLKEGEAADEEMKKLKKEAKKKVASKEVPTKAAAAGKKKTNGTKKASGGSDEDHSNSPDGSLNGDNNAAADNDEDDDDVQWQTDTSLAAAQQRIQEQLNSVTAEMVMLSTLEAEKEKEKSAKAKREESLVSQIKKKLSDGSTPSEIHSFLDSIEGASSEDNLIALFEALFDGAGKGFAKEVGKNRKYLTMAVRDEATQMHLLKAVECFCADANVEAVKEVPLALKVLYDADLAEEDAIVEWYEKGSADDMGKSSQMWKNVKPFVEWLQNAESGSEED